MVKKPPVRKKVDLSKLKSAAVGLGKFAEKAVSSHPVALGLTLMAAAKAANIINTLATGTDPGPRSRDVSLQLEGLYSGAQAVALASVIVPAAASIVGSVAGALTPSLPVEKKEVPSSG